MHQPKLTCESELAKYMFLVEWFDEKAELKREYLLTYHTKAGAVEMYDLKNRRLFLKKTPVDLRPEDLFLGAQVNLFGRQILLVDYADLATREHLTRRKERTFGVVACGGLAKMGEVMDVIARNCLQLVNARLVNMATQHLSSHLAPKKENPIMGSSESCLKSPILLLEIRGEGAISKWRSLLGESLDNDDDKIETSASFSDELKPYLHCPAGCDQKSIDAVYGEVFERLAPCHCNTAEFCPGTLAIIKPHAIRDGKHGRIIQRILEHGYSITALETFHLNKPTAEEFLEIYRGVVSEFPDMVEEFISGPVIAMEVTCRQDPTSTHASFRKFVGPVDPEVAHLIRKNTLRDEFGTDRVKNAVHCTDLQEDTILEVEYFFKILALRVSSGSLKPLSCVA